MKETIYITSATRTAVGSLGKTLKNIPAYELGASVISRQVFKKIKAEKLIQLI